MSLFARSESDSRRVKILFALCYVIIVNKSFYKLISPAILAASLALFSNSAMFAFKLSPFVASLSLANRNGVSCLPIMPFTCYTEMAWEIAVAIFAGFSESFSGIGLTISTPPSNPMSHFVLIICAASLALSARASSLSPLLRE